MNAVDGIALGLGMVACLSIWYLVVREAVEVFKRK